MKLLKNDTNFLFRHTQNIVNQYFAQVYIQFSSLFALLKNELLSIFFGKNLFNSKIYSTFAPSNTTYSYSTHSSTLIKDNTPSRLAAMQHTWEVFSFYTPTKYQYFYAYL